MIPDNVGICTAVKAANGYYSNRMETLDTLKNLKKKKKSRD